MFHIEMLPASRGDCLWIEYGDAASPRRVLIDGGVHATHRALRTKLLALPENRRRFELLIVTHIDLDHIAGVLELLRDPPPGLAFDQIWFNAWEHLDQAAKDSGVLGPAMGESLSELIAQRGLDAGWNRDFARKPVMIPDTGPLPTFNLPDGLKLTLLGPTRARLIKLLPIWEKAVRDDNLESGRAAEIGDGHKSSHPDEEELADDSGVLGDDDDLERLAGPPFSKDNSVANGSSIAVLAEIGGKSCLLIGDAYPDDIAAALNRLAPGKLTPIDALKISHHGGHKNTSNSLLDAVACSRFLFSTDGTGSAKHPHVKSVSRVLTRGRVPGKPIELLFNYPGPTARWDTMTLRDRYEYAVTCPAPGDVGLRVVL